MIFWTLLLAAQAEPSVLDRYAAPLIAAPDAPSEAAEPGASPFAWVVEPLELAPGASGKLVIRLVVPPGTHVYRDQLEVAVADAGGLQVGAPSLPPGVHKADPADPVVVREQYDLDVIVEVPITAPASASGLLPVRLAARVQGCREGLCFPPAEQALEAAVRVRAAATGPR